MTLALIDNKDSFTFNIVEILRKMPRCEISVFPYDEINPAKLEKYDKIIISPGPGLPYEFPELDEIIKAFCSEKPMLGICLGHEAICQFFGANLIRLPGVVHGQPKQIIIQNDSVLFQNIPGKFQAGLYHSWVIDNNCLPEELIVTGLSEDGYVMAVEHNEYKLFGVQFHPESVITQYGKELIGNFLNI